MSELNNERENGLGESLFFLIQRVKKVFLYNPISFWLLGIKQNHSDKAFCCPVAMSLKQKSPLKS